MSTTKHLDVLNAPLEGISQIEASAGTGKTWNICALYLRLLLEKQLTVQQILVVTFTKSATAELRERIRTRLGQLLSYFQGTYSSSNDKFIPDLGARLRDVVGFNDQQMIGQLDLALQTFDEASIFTIHSFCQRAMADTPFAAGLPLSNELLADDKIHRLEVVNDFWRTHIAGSALADTLAFYLEQCGDKPERFDKLLKICLGKPRAEYVWPKAPTEQPGADADTLRRFYEDARAIWRNDLQRQAAVTIVEKAMAMRALHGQSYKPDRLASSIEGWTVLMEEADEFANLSDVGLLKLFTTSTLSAKTTGNNRPPEHPFFAAAEAYLTSRTELKGLLDLERLQLIQRFLTDGISMLRERKRERRISSFDDILFNLDAAIQNPRFPWLVQSLYERFPAALIDEFQDTDPLQFNIFQSIYQPNDGPLFFVGDPKQSIYSFRGADLHSYLHAKSITTATYSLAKNQRSCAGLIAAQNAMFGANPRAFMLDGLSYTDVEVGEKERKDFTDTDAQRGALHIWMLPKVDNKPILQKPGEALAAQATAAEIARLLRGAQEGTVCVGDRPVEAGDIAVLVRTHRQGSAIRAALGALNIGSVELSQQNVFTSLDADEIDCILKAVHWPAKTSNLLAALATEALGCLARDIEEIASDDQRLLTYGDRFSNYRDMWLNRGFAFMYRRLLNEEGITKRLLQRTDGERRVTNLLHLGELLHEAAQQHDTPATLMRWFAVQRQDAGKEEVAQLRLESDRNLVQIVTIHKSKGLEYPIVFCPYLWLGRSIPREDGTPGKVYHNNNGKMVIDFEIDPEHLKTVSTVMRKEQAAEDLRLAYVALTRAVHRCYLIAGCYGKPAGKGITTKPSQSSTLNWFVAGSGVSLDDWFSAKVCVDSIDKSWLAFASGAPGHIHLEEVPQECGSAIDEVQVDPAALTAEAFPKVLRPAWRSSSFSGMLHDAIHELAAVDHDARTTIPLADTVATDAALTEDDIVFFPKGASPGDCIHAVFEAIDFTDRTSWPPAVTQSLARYPQRLRKMDKAKQDALLPLMLTQMVDNVLSTEVLPGFRLDSLPWSRRRTELEFYISVQNLAPRSLNGFLQRYGYSCPQLTFKEMDGYLKGFIDLVFKFDDKYYILDWKGTFLGEASSSYTQDHCRNAMADAGYHLQHLIYTIALHRYLKRRVVDYDYNRHFGGVIYLFVRGVRPNWQTEQGPCGVFFDRPKDETVTALDELFAAHTEGSLA